MKTLLSTIVFAIAAFVLAGLSVVLRATSSSEIGCASAFLQLEEINDSGNVVQVVVQQSKLPTENNPGVRIYPVKIGDYIRARFTVR